MLLVELYLFCTVWQWYWTMAEVLERPFRLFLRIYDFRLLQGIVAATLKMYDES